MTWEEAQTHCERKHMVLFQYDREDKCYANTKTPEDRLCKAYFANAADMGAGIFLGLKRDVKVTIAMTFTIP